jgi:para-aminobenzoate synthetase component 1
MNVTTAVSEREPAVAVELTPPVEPWAACRRVAAAMRHVAFLDSALPHPSLGGHSYVTGDPFAVLRARGDRVTIDGRQLSQNADPLEELAAALARWQLPTQPGLPPFQGGAVGLFGYDLCHRLERLPRPAWDDFQVPDLCVGLYDWVYAYDHLERRGWVIATGLPHAPASRRRNARRRVEQVAALLGRPARAMPVSSVADASPRLAPRWPLPGVHGVSSNFDKGAYLDAVRRAIEYTHAGDCFQVNVAQRLLAPAPASPLELYGRLRERNAAPFAGYFDTGDFVIASASPERFLRVDRGLVETRPIKGTRPCGATPDEDAARRAELLASAKDRAENIMIVDLLRNDLGRVCEYGSVTVPAVCQLETYRYVHHLVSQVRGRLRADKGPVDLLRAAFPGGSVTGAPKIRAMQIIAELEPTARGAYCGSLGYLGFDGSMDSNILIRTFTLGRGWAQFPVGGGIVADSDPEREYQETLHKARGLLRALEP